MTAIAIIAAVAYFLHRFAHAEHEIDDLYEVEYRRQIHIARSHSHK